MIRAGNHNHRRVAWIAVPLALLALCAFAAPASAAEWQQPLARVYLTNLPPGGAGFIEIIPRGGGSGPVTVTDTLPEGVTATDAGSSAVGGLEIAERVKIEHNLWHCAGATVVTCTSPEGAPTIIFIAVKVDPKASSGTVLNRVTVVGGGASNTASTTDPITISSQPASFGLSGWNVSFYNEDGTVDMQAGSHPYRVVFAGELATVLTTQELIAAGGEPRNFETRLPPGFVGNNNGIPQCTRQQFDFAIQESGPGCPAETQVGVLESLSGGYIGTVEPLYNMVPPAGVAAEFAFNYIGLPVFFDTVVRSGGNYGLTTHVDNTPRRNITSFIVTLFGTVGGKPFLTLPTSCGGSQPFGLNVNDWPEPNFMPEMIFHTSDSNGNPIGFTGCERLVHFSPTMSAAPDTASADTPAGLTVAVRVPQGLNPKGLATSGLKDTKVVLPEGVVINPGQAAGLIACQPSQENLGGETDAFDGPPSCPSASKVGTAEIDTPLLKDTLKGNIYILQSNPPHLQLLLAASGDGVNVKLVGKVELDEKTGRLTTTFNGNPPGFEGTPDVPVTEIRTSFSGGAQAALSTPTACGTYATEADFTPWSTPFVADASSSSSFQITSGPGGGPCPSSPLPFSPSMIAGSTTDQAGGFTNFSLLLQTGDAQQRIEKLQFKVPPGLSGMISQVPLCQEPQAALGTCPVSSQIGHVVVASGPGPYPLVVPQPGQPPAPIYLTGPYKGAPFGLSIVVPLVVGPFVLETQKVRAKIEVDPHTAQITVTTDPFPQIVAGVPTDLRSINSVIDRPGFMFNPTNCSPLSFSGTAFSAQGASAAISSHFQMGSCRALLFQPDFKVSTSGHTSRANGASLDAKVVYPTGPLGANQASSQSNIASVKVELPKKLPSRLTTLQKACTAQVFEANPANCPPASIVGHATAVTPVLPVPLAGPAYFVSHGGEAFPSLIVVLQGDGVTVDLVGSTFINAGITSSTFKDVPDVPIYSFDLTLPEGPFSALAANGNLCKSTLTMPTDFIAQNGAVLHQNTRIAVTGCSRNSAHHHAKQTKKKARKKRARGGGKK